MLEKIKLGGFILLLIILLVYLVIGSSRKKEIIVKPNEQIKKDKSIILGSCKMLEEKYCRIGKHITIGVNSITAFRLPAGVPIFSPFAGVVTIWFPAAEPGSPKTYYIDKMSYITIWKGVHEKDRTKKNRKSVVITYTGVEENGIKNGSLVKKGDILARTGETNIDTVVTLGCNLFLATTKIKIGIGY